MGVLATHAPRDLDQVIQVVSHPGREMLAEGNLAELGVSPGTLQICWCKPHRYEAPQAVRAKVTEGVQ